MNEKLKNITLSNHQALMERAFSFDDKGFISLLLLKFP